MSGLVLLFKSGDVILEVGGTKVATAADIRKAVGVAQKNGKHAVVMRVKSDDKTKFVAISLLFAPDEAVNSARQDGDGPEVSSPVF